MDFLEYQACTAAGLDLWKWECYEYPKWFKAKVISWYNNQNLLNMHSEDARAKASSRK